MRRGTYVVAVAVAAALLFMVQPMVARFLLPAVGGSTVVWSSALVFFQVALLVGYLLAHVFVRVPIRAQPVVFVGALVLAGASTLPFALSGRVPDWSAPGPWVIAELACMVGAVFVVLSASSPLLQRWYSQLDEPDSAEPYRLYAASNVGSIGGLIAYPVLVEPLATLEQQATGWALGFALLLLLIVGCAVQSRGSVTPDAVASDGDPPDRATAIWWVVCAAIPSALLVTMTASITADIAPVPLLWVVPLVVYLGSHVWVFSRRPPRQERALAALVIAVVPYTGVVIFDLAEPWWLFASAAVLILGIVAVAYHGELVRTRPHPRFLTSFYLWIAFGGALGGAFATFGGPALFDTLVELPLELICAVLLLPSARSLKRSTPRLLASLAFIGVVYLLASTFEPSPDLRTPVACGVAAFAVLAFGMHIRFGVGWLLLATVAGVFSGDAIGTERGPYSRYRIDSSQSELGEFRSLVVGRVIHGTQARDEKLRLLPLSYYHPTGPPGQLLKAPPVPGPLADIGLGIGAIAAYATPEMPVTFFEIDPLVERIARNPKYFTHLIQCGNLCDVEIGDGRLSIGAVADGTFGVILLDAFAGDAVPTHLVTVEAFELYRSKLREGGVIIVNTTNSYIDLSTVVINAAAALGVRAVSQDYWPRAAYLRKLAVSRSSWVVISSNGPFMDRLAADPRWTESVGVADAAWTDNWQNLFAYYTWR